MNLNLAHSETSEKPDPNIKPCRQVSDEVHETAIEKVNKGVSIIVAANKNRIDYTVLCRRLKKR